MIINVKTNDDFVTELYAKKTLFSFLNSLFEIFEYIQILYIIFIIQQPTFQDKLTAQ